jgi:hypothetical protein
MSWKSPTDRHYEGSVMPAILAWRRRQWALLNISNALIDHLSLLFKAAWHWFTETLHPSVSDCTNLVTRGEASRCRLFFLRYKVLCETTQSCISYHMLSGSFGDWFLWFENHIFARCFSRWFLWLWKRVFVGCFSQWFLSLENNFFRR